MSVHLAERVYEWEASFPTARSCLDAAYSIVKEVESAGDGQQRFGVNHENSIPRSTTTKPDGANDT